MKLRLETIRSLLGKFQLSHLLISDPVDVSYISGFTSSNAVLLVSKRSNKILTDFRYSTSVDRFCKKHSEWSNSIITSCMADTIASFLSDSSRVGFQSDHYTVDKYNHLKKKCGKTRFISVSGPVRNILITKTAAELSAMKKAAAIGDKAFTLLLDDLKTGATELHCARQLERHCADLGSEKPSFDTIVLFGANSALPHGKPGGRKLKNGDTILIDFGCTVKGFASDMTRTVFKGTTTKKQRDLYQLVNHAQNHACNHAHAGMQADAIDALARTIISTAGYGKEFGHALGHGVGRRIHEAPRVSAHTKQLLPENCVITIEPGIYLPGVFGIRIEDTLILKNNGITLLTHTSKELIEV